MDFSKILDSLDPRLLEKILSLENQGHATERNYSHRDQGWIDTEANFVDEKILKVGNRPVESDKIHRNSFKPAFWWSQTEPHLRKQLTALSTPEDRVEFVGKYLLGVHVQQTLLESKLGICYVCFELLERGVNYKESLDLVFRISEEQ